MYICSRRKQEKQTASRRQKTKYMQDAENHICIFQKKKKRAQTTNPSRPLSYVARSSVKRQAKQQNFGFVQYYLLLISFQFSFSLLSPFKAKGVQKTLLLQPKYSQGLKALYGQSTYPKVRVIRHSLLSKYIYSYSVHTFTRSRVKWKDSNGTPPLKNLGMN